MDGMTQRARDGGVSNMDNGMDPLPLITGLVMGQNGVSKNHLIKGGADPT